MHPISGECNLDKQIGDMRALIKEFEVHGQMRKLRKVFEKQINVILDVRNLSENDLRILREAIEREGLGDRILWYP